MRFDLGLPEVNFGNSDLLACAPCLGADSTTVLFRPSVHRVSRVTYSVHFSKCSFLGNHGKITINGSPAFAELEILTVFDLFEHQNLDVTVTRTQSVQFRGPRHASPEHSVEIVQ